MGLHIIHDPTYYDGAAVFVCSTSGTAFGPLMERSALNGKGLRYHTTAESIAKAFIMWLVNDPRRLSPEALESEWGRFVEAGITECANCEATIPKTYEACSPECIRALREERMADAEYHCGFGDVTA